MAFRDDEISQALTDDARRDALSSPYDRQGLEYQSKERRHTFKISTRLTPEFAANDFELRLVVSQTAYNHFEQNGRHRRWQRVPEHLTIDPASLAVLIVERLAQQSGNKPELLTRFNTTKDYTATLSAIAYLKWRLGWRQLQIANYLTITE